MPKRDRKPTAQEIEILKLWIESGAATAHEEPEVLTAGMQITPEERSHWAFRPVVRPPVPRVPRVPVQNPIDAFLAARQATRQLTFSPEAAPATLVRRAFLDLWGLPPTPSDLAAFALDGSDQAYTRLLQKLLLALRSPCRARVSTTSRTCRWSFRATA